eukprot:349838_1
MTGAVTAVPRTSITHRRGGKVFVSTIAWIMESSSFSPRSDKCSSNTDFTMTAKTALEVIFNRCKAKVRIRLQFSTMSFTKTSPIFTHSKLSVSKLSAQCSTTDKILLGPTELFSGIIRVRRCLTYFRPLSLWSQVNCQSTINRRFFETGGFTL